MNNELKYQPLRGIRLEAGITVTKLAQVVSKSRVWVHDRERCIGTVSHEDAMKLAAFFEREPTELFDEGKIRHEAKAA